jgi:hypothetical protein
MSPSTSSAAGELSDRRGRRPLARWLATVAAALALVALGLAAGGAAPVAPATVDGGAPATPSPNVKVVFQTVPPEKAVVYWGKRPLGIINRIPKRSLIIERPRDSGPLDVVVRAKGYLPIHTRAYTFTDSKVFVKLTLLEEKKTLFGYRAEIPDGGAPDGGVPPGAPVGPPVMSPPVMGPPVMGPPVMGPPARSDAGAR